MDTNNKITTKLCNFFASFMGFFENIIDFFEQKMKKNNLTEESLNDFQKQILPYIRKKPNELTRSDFYYLYELNRIHEAKKANKRIFSWNWSAAFFNIFWGIYRKIPAEVITIFGKIVIFCMLLTLIIELVVLYFSDNLVSISFSLFVFLALNFFWLGSDANVRYYERIIKKINQKEPPSSKSVNVLHVLIYLAAVYLIPPIVKFFTGENLSISNYIIFGILIYSIPGILIYSIPDMIRDIKARFSKN